MPKYRCSAAYFHVLPCRILMAQQVLLLSFIERKTEALRSLVSYLTSHMSGEGPSQGLNPGLAPGLFYSIVILLLDL